MSSVENLVFVRDLRVGDIFRTMRGRNFPLDPARDYIVMRGYKGNNETMYTIFPLGVVVTELFKSDFSIVNHTRRVLSDSQSGLVRLKSNYFGDAGRLCIPSPSDVLTRCLSKRRNSQIVEAVSLDIDGDMVHVRGAHKKFSPTFCPRLGLPNHLRIVPRVA